MEISHLILSAPYVECTHTFSNINIFSGARLVEAYTPNLTRENLLDLYAKRLKKSAWGDMSDCNPEILKEMSLQRFVEAYYASKKGKILPLRPSSKPVVPVYTPDVAYFCKPDHNNYWKYCLVMLIREKPWVCHMSSVFGSDNDAVLEIESISKDQKKAIIDTFEKYFRDKNLNSYMTDQPLQRQIKNLLDQYLTLSVEDLYLSFASMETLDEKSIGNPDEYDDLENDSEMMEWDKDYD